MINAPRNRLIRFAASPVGAPPRQGLRSQGQSLRFLRAIAVGAACWATVYAPPATAQSPETSAERPRQIQVLTTDGKLVCNSDAFSQFPDDPTLFVGRLRYYADGEPMVGTAEECGHDSRAKGEQVLALYRMDWAAGQLTLGAPIISVPADPSAGGRITTAYDPTLARIGSEIWVTFECAWVSGVKRISACLAPLRPDFQVDLTRLSIPAFGDRRGGRPVASATVPRLLAYQGHSYLYWGVAHFSPATHERDRVTSRGMELETDGAGRLWGKGSGGRPVACDDQSITRLVAAPLSQEPSADMRAQIESIREISGGRFEALVAVGGTGCDTPISPVPGCYRLMKSIATEPLGENAFGRDLKPVSVLPINPEEYSRFFVRPDGSSVVIGMFRKARTAYPGKVVPPGLWQFPDE